MNLLKWLFGFPMVYRLATKMANPRCTPVQAMGLNFPNMIGLGAGFDKNAKYLRELEVMGFGHVEIGTVTPLAQPGNDSPRLFRLPADKALINRMGFNNDGLEQIRQRLSAWNQRPQKEQTRMIIGGNIGKNKATANEDAWKDYEKCFTILYNEVDYFVVNVSSPNTPGLRELQEKTALRQILTNLQGIRKNYSVRKPILLKVAPDLTMPQLDDVIALAIEISLDGLVVSNTTLDRTGLSKTSLLKAEGFGAGGLSGLPLKEKSTSILSYISTQTDAKLLLIGSGGIFTAADAKEKINAGASLIQVWTGFIYEGPVIVKKICKGLRS